MRSASAIALGARRRDILWQFLIEAMVLSVTGGLIGMAATKPAATNDSVWAVGRQGSHLGSYATLTPDGWNW